MRASFVVVGVLFVSACRGGVTAPSASPAAVTPLSAISGTVHDTIGRPLSGARVEVIDGPQRGLAALADEQGRYTLASGGPVLARATKDGYRERTLRINDPQSGRFFRLDSANGSLSLAGGFSMTFTADSACADIPGYARRRPYDAESRGGDAQLYLIALAGGGYNLSGAGYFNNVLYASVFEQTAQINLSDPPVWERFPQGSYLVITGVAEGSIGEWPATLPLDAEFVYCARQGPGAEPNCAVTEVRCRSSNHRLTVAPTR